MLRRIRSFIFIVIAAIAGAACGRAVAEMRERNETGEPAAFPPAGIRLRPQDVVPGIVAAFRVGDPPWSWLHIPRWLAAFAVNFAAAALTGDLQHLREMFEGGPARRDDPWRDERPAGDYVDADGAPAWNAEDAEEQSRPTA